MKFHWPNHGLQYYIKQLKFISFRLIRLIYNGKYVSNLLAWVFIYVKVCGIHFYKDISLIKNLAYLGGDWTRDLSIRSLMLYPSRYASTCNNDMVMKAFVACTNIWDTIANLLELKMSKRTRVSVFFYMNIYFEFHLV